MTKRSALVCDDDGVRVLDWVRRLRQMPYVDERYDVQPLEPAAFAAAYAALKDRRRQSRYAEPGSDVSAPQDDDAAPLDRADMLVVDFDLTPDHQLPADVNQDTRKNIQQQLDGEFGETFAYLARCYSSVGYVVVVNQRYQASTFDLTMQQFTDSHADLNVAEADLHRPELWLGAPQIPSQYRFRPWHWPRLLDAPETLQRAVRAVDLDAGVLGALGLDPGALVQDQLDPLGDRPEEATFRDLANGSALGLLRKDRQPSDAMLARIAAAGVLRWLERTVLPSQNVIVDAPHLAQRQPQLMTGENWDALARLDADPAEAGLGADALAAAVVPACGWASRPVWYWPSASGIARQLPAARPAGAWPVFCEDVSRFVDFDRAWEFNSSLPGAYRQRFVYELDDDEDPVDYRPRSRLLD